MKTVYTETVYTAAVLKQVHKEEATLTHLNSILDSDMKSIEHDFTTRAVDNEMDEIARIHTGDKTIRLGADFLPKRSVLPDTQYILTFTCWDEPDYTLFAPAAFGEDVNELIRLFTHDPDTGKEREGDIIVEDEGAWERARKIMREA